MTIWTITFIFAGVFGCIVSLVSIIVVFIDHKLPPFCYAWTVKSRLKRKVAKLQRRIDAIRNTEKSRSSCKYLEAEVETLEKELAKQAFKNPQGFVDTK